LPQALAGVSTVALLFHFVRRSFGSVAGLIVALVMAISRSNNLDMTLAPANVYEREIALELAVGT
jgi:4-amino-4-deoxy-L-arabinose transferase-like glycosyltransferase